MYRQDFVHELSMFFKRSVASLRQVKLSQLQEGISHEMIVSHSTYAPWRDDKEFLAVHDTIQSNTLVDIYRCYELWNLLKRHPQLTGDVLEVGVWRGGTGCLMASAVKGFDCTVYLADTFSGVVKPSARDTEYKGGEHADTSEQVVNDLIANLKLDNTRILKGIYPDDHSLRKDGLRLRLCHVDVDTYESARNVVEDVWDLVEPGGFVVFDDYGFWGCEGVTRLCNELQLSNAVYIHNLNGHQLVVKVQGVA